MSTFYLHVGPHKTGTTFIQKFLLDNSAELLDSNLVYPKQFLRIFGHHDFRDAVANKAISPRDLDFFNQCDSDLLLSSEDFISLETAHFEYLRSAVKRKRFVVLYAWRRAGFRLYSIWQEVVKHGGTRTFFDYFHEHLARPDLSQMLSPDLKLNMFSQVFGKENIRIIDYDASARHGTLLSDFLRALDIPWSEGLSFTQQTAEAVNRSMDYTDVEAIRALNHVAARRFGIEGTSIRVAYLRQAESLNPQGLLRLKEIIRNYHQVLTVGDYFIDLRCESIMGDLFKANIINYEPNTSVKTITVARPDWVLELEAQELIHELAERLRVVILA